jgi:hypothetical protein
LRDHATPWFGFSLPAVFIASGDEACQFRNQQSRTVEQMAKEERPNGHALTLDGQPSDITNVNRERQTKLMSFMDFTNYLRGRCSDALNAIDFPPNVIPNAVSA